MPPFKSPLIINNLFKCLRRLPYHRPATLDTISALGFPHVETPNLDRLVNEGTHFTKCFVTAPSCAPSRASLFTGYYPHTTGILKNADNWTRSWVENLSDAGYHCANIGKMHTYPYETPCGFHERHVVENKDRFLEGGQYLDEWDKFLQRGGHKKQKRVEYRKKEDYRDRLGAFTWDLPPETHSDYYVGDRAVEWLHKREKSGEEQKTPFFLEVGFRDLIPHTTHFLSILTVTRTR